MADPPIDRSAGSSLKDLTGQDNPAGHHLRFRHVAGRENASDVLYYR
jgi:hypothetical protein